MDVKQCTVLDWGKVGLSDRSDPLCLSTGFCCLQDNILYSPGQAIPDSSISVEESLTNICSVV